MGWQTFKQRISESAIDTALGAFWVAFWGVIVTALAAGILFLKGASPYVFIGLASAAFTLILVLIVTAAVVLIQRRARLSAARVGKKGFLDYKIQGQRALVRMTTSLVAITHQMERIGRQVTSDTARIARAQRGRGNTDERVYRAMKRAANRLAKRAGIMQLHAVNYAADVNLFVEGAGKWIDWLVDHGTADKKQMVEFAGTLRTLRQAMDTNIPMVERFRAVVDETRAANEDMDLAGGSLSEAVTIIIESTRIASVFCAAQIPRLGG